MIQNDAETTTKVDSLNGNTEGPSNESQARNLYRNLARVFTCCRNNEVDSKLNFGDNASVSRKNSSEIKNANNKSKETKLERKDCPDCFPKWLQTK